MKTHVLALLITFIGGTSGAWAQTFLVDWKEGPVITASPSNGTVKRSGTIRNLSDAQKELYFSYDLSGMSLDHTAQLCIDLCWQLYQGQDDPTERDPQILTPMGTLPIYVDATPYGFEGTSLVAVWLFDKNNPTDRVDFTVTFVFDATASVRTAEDAGISVGPNPASDVVSVRGTSVAGIRSASLYDASGLLVRSYGKPQSEFASFPTSGLSSGSYTLVLSSPQGLPIAIPVIVAR